MLEIAEIGTDRQTGKKKKQGSGWGMEAEEELVMHKYMVNPLQRDEKMSQKNYDGLTPRPPLRFYTKSTSTQ